VQNGIVQSGLQMPLDRLAVALNRPLSRAAATGPCAASSQKRAIRRCRLSNPEADVEPPERM
jgi:hypothetical protein